ncbi:hypothetical protein [Amycolatopsis echigonensis]|nr:hypothetical protein [Amycolatopsis niigatensis]
MRRWTELRLVALRLIRQLSLEPAVPHRALSGAALGELGLAALRAG